MKIAFIGARGVVGKYSGIETYYEEVGSRLVDLGHDVTVYCRSYFTPRIPVYRGLRIKRFPTIRSKHLETIFHSALCTMDALFRGYDVIQFHALGSSPLSIVPRIFGTKTVVSVRGLDGERAKWNQLASSYLKACEWTSARFPDRTGVVSQTLASYFQRKYGVTTTCIPNGVTIQVPRGAYKIREFGFHGRDYILYLGRLTPEKECHTLIEAFQQIGTDKKLAFVGGSTYSDDYVRQLKQHESNRIRFLGFQSGEILEELLSNAYFYVLPSRIEGLSISLLEAMGYGNCVLTSDIPENLELVQGIGFTFETGNVESLKNQIEYLLRHPDEVKLSGDAAKRHIEENYTWNVIARQTEQFYESMLPDSTAKAPSRQVTTKEEAN